MQDINFPISFVKMSGTGNDFIIIDHRTPLINLEDIPKFAAKVCRRKFSVGADGLILIENSDTADFKWQFYNADGSVAEMCGNGARCAARFAFMQGIAPATMRFETLAGVIEASISNTVAVRMTDPLKLRMNLEVIIDDTSTLLHSIDTGVPHAVVFVEDIDTLDVCASGSSIRHHQFFMPAGTNVNFVQQQGDGFKVRTYERGVEDETMACGTGAVACALIASRLGLASSPVQIITSGNDRLDIIFESGENTSSPEFSNVFLQGAAHVVYNGKLNAESLL